jgi:hypothetical protein
MFDGVEDYDFNGSKSKKYGCLLLILSCSLLIIFGIFIGWLIF